MNNRKKRVRRHYKNFKKSNFVFLNKILRILSWLLPGLVIKRWMITSAIGFLRNNSNNLIQNKLPKLCPSKPLPSENLY